MSYDKDLRDEIRRYADTWIIVVAIFFSLSIAGLSYFFPLQEQGNNTVELDFEQKLKLFLYGGIIFSLAVALVFFLRARDPRGRRAPRHFVNAGVTAVYVAIIFTALRIWRTAETRLNDSAMSYFTLFSICVVASFFFGFYLWRLARRDKPFDS